MDPAIRLLRDLIAINSVNPTLVPGAPGEREIADAVAAAMRRSGLDVSVEDAGGGRPNVVGVLEGRIRGRSLMFCGHTDTVGVDGMEDPFTPVERDGRVFGRGAQDMKGGLAAMIDAARRGAAPVDGDRFAPRLDYRGWQRAQQLSGPRGVAARTAHAPSGA